MIFKGRFFYCLLLVIGGFALFSFTFRAISVPHSDTISCEEILQTTLTAIEQIKTLKFHLKCNERINGKLFESESQVKLNRAPRKIYVFLKGPELLWQEGKNDRKALVNPNGFPFINLNLDPMGSIMRENQHHTIYEIGFEYFADIIKNSLEKEGFENYFKCTGTLVWDSRECYLISAEYPEFGFENYVIKKGETISSIAKNLKVSDYMILEHNSSVVSNYNHGKPGQVIKVPNVYGKKLILYIDKELFVPRVIKIYDDKGIYEVYEYHELEVNPIISDEEFTKEYKGYRF